MKTNIGNFCFVVNRFFLFLLLQRRVTLEPRQLRAECQLNRSGRAVPLLCDDNVGYVRIAVIGLALMVIILPLQQQHTIDGLAVTAVGDSQQCLVYRAVLVIIKRLGTEKLGHLGKSRRLDYDRA